MTTDVQEERMRQVLFEAGLTTDQTERVLRDHEDALHAVMVKHRRSMPEEVLAWWLTRHGFVRTDDGMWEDA